jgi:putative hydrolase of the HAD superfamily
MPIKCVFFDFDEVVRSWKHEFDGLSDYSGIPLDAFVEIAFDPLRYESAIRGEVSGETLRAEIGLVLAECFSVENAESALEYWATRNGELIPEVLEIVRLCKERIPVALFTNASTTLNREIETLGLTGLFDHVVNTAEVGSIKPEPEIYKYALDLVGIEASEAYFTDDRPENIEAAVKLGWTGHLFDGDVVGLRSSLVKTGVLLTCPR